MSESAPLRLIFAGTPEFAAIHLDALLAAGEHEVVAVYSQPDRPAGRGKKLQASPVKQRAVAAGIPVYQPNNFRDAADREQLAALNADLMVVVAYGLILPRAVLDTPRLGCINVHASLLPRWRGAAPIQRAIAAGDSETGVTIMQMDEGLDTGAMLLKSHCAIADEDTAASLHDKLAALGGPALNEALQRLAAGNIVGEVQDDSLSCYAAKIDKAEGAIDWNLHAAELARRVRAFNPFPGCYSELDGERIKVWNASADTAASADSGAEPGTIVSADGDGIVVCCGHGSLRLTELQLPGARRLAARDILNARAALFAPGARFQHDG